MYQVNRILGGLCIENLKPSISNAICQDMFSTPSILGDHFGYLSDEPECTFSSDLELESDQLDSNLEEYFDNKAERAGVETTSDLIAVLPAVKC